jgi:mono/diheme cytochrome c family protein
MALFVVATLGFAACGGDADDGDAMAQTGDQMDEMADDAAGAMDEMGDDAEDAMAGATQELPAGVTAAMVAEGKTIYAGAGICSSCHGPAGEGIPNLGANLGDGEWLHSEGDYEGIVQTVMTGVTADKSSSGVPMPAKAGTNITDNQVKAVAAYVWTLSH